MRHSSLNYICKLILKKYYQISPKPIKKFISPLIFFIKFRIASKIENLTLDIYVLKGKEKSGGNSLTILFLGNKISLMFIKYKLFKDEPKIDKFGEVNFFNINKILNRFSKKVDAVFVKTDIFFSGYLQKKGFLVMPAWVELKLDTSNDLKEIEKKFKKSAYEDIRLINKIGYTYEITDKPDDFEYYYHKIRLPYLKERLGDLTLPSTMEYEETKDIFQRSKFLIVKENDNIVSGIFILSHLNSAHACYMGVKNPSYYLPRGAGAALYYFLILWSKEHDVEVLDFGNNRPFLDNGSFQYKRKWGSSVSISKRFLEIFAFRIYNFESKAIVDFLINNPFTFIEEKKLKGMIFSNDQLSQKDISKLYNQYYTGGLKQLHIVSIGNKLKETWNYLFQNKDSKKRGEESFSKVKRDAADILLYSDKKLYPFKSTNLDNFNHDVEIDTEQNMSLVRRYDINSSQAKKIISDGHEKKFVKLVEKFPDLKKEIVKTFIHTFEGLKRQGVDVNEIDVELLVNIFSHLSEKRFDSESLPNVLNYVISNGKNDITNSIRHMNLHVADEKEIKDAVDKVVADHLDLIRNRGIHSLDILMGIIMQDLKCKANGKLVSQLLNDEIKKVLQN